MSDPNEQGIPAPEGPANLIETEYEVGQDNVEVSVGPFGLDIHNPVFAISGLTIVAFVFITLAFQESAGAAFGDLRDWLTGTFDWFFLTAANVFVLLCLFLIVSPYGKVRIGGKDATPDYSYTGWFAMLFAAGMGIGLMFYGVSEPISHFSSSVAEGAGSADSWAPLGGAAGEHRGSARSRHGRDDLPLGPAPMGDLRHCRTWRWRCFPTTRACR
jgi:BCCT family betaine/carnitine transporter